MTSGFTRKKKAPPMGSMRWVVGVHGIEMVTMAHAGLLCVCVCATCVRNWIWSCCVQANCDDGCITGVRCRKVGI